MTNAALRHAIRRLLHAVPLLLILAASVRGGRYSQLIVFGDSLSDNGNAANATLGLQPGAYYHAGRFTNGLNYADRLAAGLGFGELLPSSSGGGNFAFAAAQTTGTDGLAGFFIRDIDEQVDEFLTQGPADPNALVVMFAGAVDLINGQTDVDRPVDNLRRELERLIRAGAGNFLVLNAPPLGFTPRYNREPAIAETLNQLTFEFNTALDTALDSLEAQSAGVELIRLDVAELFTEVAQNPAAFGIVDASNPAAPGLEPGADAYDTSLIVADPDAYLFWDEIHPTAIAHAMLADRALALIPEPPAQHLLALAGLIVGSRFTRRRTSDSS